MRREFDAAPAHWPVGNSKRRQRWVGFNQKRRDRFAGKIKVNEYDGPLKNVRGGEEGKTVSQTTSLNIQEVLMPNWCW